MKEYPQYTLDAALDLPWMQFLMLFDATRTEANSDEVSFEETARKDELIRKKRLEKYQAAHGG